MPETSSARMAPNTVADSGKGKDSLYDQLDWDNLSKKEKEDIEAGLSIYCRPVEFYNILLHRDIKHPLFLQRCLDYRIKAKRQNRIPLTVCLSWNDDKSRSLFPLCVCLARLDRSDEPQEGAENYHPIRIITFQSSSKVDGNGSAKVQANFMLPKLDEAKHRNYYVFIFGSAENRISLSYVNGGMGPWDEASNECGELCLYGKISMKNFHWIWNAIPEIPEGQRIQIQCRLNLLPCILMYFFQSKSKSISILDSMDSPTERDLQQLEVKLLIGKSGDREKSSYHTLANREAGSSSSTLAQIIRLKEGNVAFKYRYYYKEWELEKVEVTEDFTCPLCLVKCASFKGLCCHLSTSHDLLNFEFSELSGTPSVQVSIKGDWRLEIVGDIDPKIHIQNFCAKRLMRRDKPLVEPEIAAGDTELLEKHDGSNAIILRPGPDCAPTESYQDNETAAGLEVDQEGFSKAIILHPGPACVPPVFDQDHGTRALPQAVQEGVSNAIILHPGPNHCLPPIPPCDRGTPAVRQVGKRSRLLIEHHDEKMVAKLRKRKFYHSHKYQPMELEEVLRDEDSEDEINEHAQEIQDRMKIARLDATDDAKQFITQWNLFVKKHRVLADGHVNWAFEAFTKYHCADIAPSPILSWRWKELAIKLSNHGLVKPQTVLASNNLLEEYRKMNPDISQQLNKFQI